MTALRKDLFEAIRPFAPNRKFAALDVADIDELADRFGLPREVTIAEPRWITVARSLLGTREIPGPQHSSFIAKGWARLGAGWFNDDETPWCGFFVAHCMDAAGLSYPGKGEFARAASWATYGIPVSVPAVGTIGVKKRTGGNHVFFIVGETPDKRFFKALGGNQSNAVTIMDIAKADVTAMRWPSGVPLPADRKLPVLAPGTISRNEA